jgi:dynein heavy chain
VSFSSPSPQVKDLAKNLAFFCVVTNCGENLDYKSLGRIFSGLCQSGSWGCFDEFNRIKIEVISVAAVQIGSILNAQRNSLVTFSFLGVEIPRQEGTGIFITMNPGYAGRTELPDNLKALLRPVAMMAPDLALITEVILASEGFACGKSLAQRIIVIYRLMQQQLSKCSHYDFGLRNIKSVLTMAGSLKRQNSNEEEAMIIIRSLIGLNEPRFLCKDKVLFHLLLVDLFPEENLDLSSDELLSNSIDRVMRFNGLYPDKALVEKTVQLAHSQKARHSNMLIGETMTGKTTIWKSLSIAKTKLDSHHPNYATSVKTQVLNPKALSIAELYGSYDTATFEWSDGVLSTLFKGCAENELEGKKGSEQWIVFDGPVDALWIESMNSVMDDSKILTLINGDRVSMTNSMSLLFEVEDLQVASPATVSRAGMIFVDCAPKWRAVIQRWLDGAKVGVLTEGKDHILNLCEKVRIHALDGECNVNFLSLMH